MNIIFFLPIIFSYDDKNCLQEDGSYIININFHLDELTFKKIIVIEEIKNMLKTNMGSHEIVIDYLNRILNEINKDLEIYGVQVVGNYDLLLFEELEIGLQKKKLCNTEFMAVEATSAIIPKLMYPKTDGLGLRIVGLSCPYFDPIQIPLFAYPSGSCGNLGTVFVIDPYTLKKQIKFLIKSFISGDLGVLFPIKSKYYRKFLCKYVNKCTKKTDYIGKFVKNLKKVEYLPEKKKNSIF